MAEVAPATQSPGLTLDSPGNGARYLTTKFSSAMFSRLFMLKHIVSLSVTALLLLDAAMVLADSTQNHHCKLQDGSVDAKKTHKECAAVKGEWAAEAAPTKKTSEPASPVAPAPPATPSREVPKPAPPTSPATDAAKPGAPVGNNTQTHHCRMPDNTMDMKKTHNECEAAKGQWAKDESAPTTPVADNTQDHHCRLPDRTIDAKKSHKECEAAKGEWAKDANSK